MTFENQDFRDIIFEEENDTKEDEMEARAPTLDECEEYWPFDWDLNNQ